MTFQLHRNHRRNSHDSTVRTVVGQPPKTPERGRRSVSVSLPPRLSRNILQLVASTRSNSRLSERHPLKMSIGEIIDFTSLDANIQELIRESVAARENSHSPYSNFKVGAAVRCVDGSISRGCNVENASYPAGVCAEVAAFAGAVSEGKRKVTVLAVAADHEATTFTTPCGVCRQFLSEFGNIPIYLTRTDMKKILRTELNELLPASFRTNDTEIS